MRLAFDLVGLAMLWAILLAFGDAGNTNHDQSSSHGLYGQGNVVVLNQPVYITRLDRT